MSKPRPLTVIAALLIAVGAAAYLWPRLQNDDKRFVLLPDTGGPIESVACNVNSARRAALRNADLTSNIVNALPEQTKCLLLTNDRGAFTVAQNPWPDRVEFLELPAHSAFTIWTQDPMLGLRDSVDQVRLLVSRRFDRADDRLIAESLSQYLGATCDKSSLTFEGGNIVSDERMIFVGGNTVRINAIELELSDVEVVRILEKELGRAVLVVGRVPQPVGHIDMMLTPLGNGRLVLANASSGAMLAENDLQNHPDAVDEFEQRCERQFFGHPQITTLQNTDGEDIRPPQIIGQTARAIADSRAIANDLDRLASELAKRGYRVSRMPFLQCSQQNEPTESDPVQRPGSGPGYPTLTYNNVLIEHRSGAAIVYLPQYGWDALDAAAQSAWRELGFDIRPVNGLAVSAMYGGSLRCCVKVLGRRNPNKT